MLTTYTIFRSNRKRKQGRGYLTFTSSSGGYLETRHILYLRSDLCPSCGRTASGLNSDQLPLPRDCLLHLENTTTVEDNSNIHSYTTVLHDTTPHYNISLHHTTKHSATFNLKKHILA